MAASTSTAAATLTPGGGVDIETELSPVTGPDLLVILVDLTLMWWGNQPVDISLAHCLESVLVLCNSHLIVSPMNEIAVLGIVPERSEFLYPTEGVGQMVSGMGRYEALEVVNQSIRERAETLIVSSRSDRLDVSMCGAVVKALQYYTRRSRECGGVGRGVKSRILVVKGAEDSQSQYMALMNAVFTAQKLQIPIDTCALVGGSVASGSSPEVGLLQQAAHLTGGIFLTVPQPRSLLLYLLSVFLPSTALRQFLILPGRSPAVDIRAACFCHRRLVEIGYVCSVCLSVFCEFSPICATCHAQFRQAPVAPGNKKKPA